MSMPTLIKTIKCPICGKGSALRSASFKKSSVENLGEIVIQECQGRHGFKKISTSPMIDELNDPRIRELVDELGDSSSCVLVTFMEQGLDLDTRGMIDMYRKLEEKYRDTVKDAKVKSDVSSAELDDMEREIASLKEKIASYVSQLDELREKSDADDRKIEELKEKLRKAYEEIDLQTSEYDELNKVHSSWVKEKEKYQKRIKALGEELDVLRSKCDDYERKGSPPEEWAEQERKYKQTIRELTERLRIKESQLQKYDVEALDFDLK